MFNFSILLFQKIKTTSKSNLYFAGNCYTLYYAIYVYSQA